jgi:hypothetical protein
MWQLMMRLTKCNCLNFILDGIGVPVVINMAMHVPMAYMAWDHAPMAWALAIVFTIHKWH